MEKEDMEDEEDSDSDRSSVDTDDYEMEDVERDLEKLMEVFQNCKDQLSGKGFPRTEGEEPEEDLGWLGHADEETVCRWLNETIKEEWVKHQYQEAEKLKSAMYHAKNLDKAQEEWRKTGKSQEKGKKPDKPDDEIWVKPGPSPEICFVVQDKAQEEKKKQPWSDSTIEYILHGKKAGKAEQEGKKPDRAQQEGKKPDRAQPEWKKPEKAQTERKKPRKAQTEKKLAKAQEVCKIPGPESKMSFVLHGKAEEEWKKSGIAGKKPQFSSFDLDEAWQRAYPESKDFINFFIQKLKFYDTGAKDMMEIVNKNEHTLQARVESYYGQKEKLQKTVDMARTELVARAELIGKEREWYQKLIGTYKQKEIDCEDWRRKYYAVLHLTKTKDKDVNHFMRNNPNAPAIIDKMCDVREEIDKCGQKPNKYLSMCPMSLGKRIEFLHDEVTAARQLSRERVDSLQRVYKIDRETMVERITTAHEEAKAAAASNKDLQELLNKTLVENLKLQNKLRENETTAANERKRLVKMIRVAYNEPTDQTLTPDDLLDTDLTGGAQMRMMKENVKRLECSLLKETNTVDQLRKDNLKLMKDLNINTLKERFVVDKCHDEARKFVEKIKILENRIANDTNRRKLDGAGFREDIKHLRKTLDKLEKMMKYSSLKYSIVPEELPFREPYARPKSAKRCASAPDHRFINHNAEARLVQEIKDDMCKEELALFSSRKAEIRGIVTAFQRADKNIFDLYDKLRKADM